MKYYSLMEKRWGKAAFGVFLLTMLLLARDTLVTSCLVGFNRSQFLMVGILAAFGIVFLIRNRKQWKQLLTDRRMIWVGISVLALVVPMVCKQDWQIMYFSVLVCLFFAVFLTFFTSVGEVSRYYVVIMGALGLYSIFATYILRYLMILGKLPEAPVFFNASGWPFYNYGLCYAVTWGYWFRNFGIFREPGVYQFFLLIALYLNNYKAGWEKKSRLWILNGILSLTMFSTFAVGGIIEMGLLYVFLYFDRKWYRTTRGKVLGASIVVVGAAALACVAVQASKPGSEGTIFFIFTDFITRLTTDNASRVDRLDAIFVSANFFLKHPLFGDTIASVLHGTAHNTSSTLILYAVLGIFGGSLNVAAWVALAWEKKRNVVGNLFLLVILFMSFNTQNLIADVFFWLFPWMALVERTTPGRKEGGD